MKKQLAMLAAVLLLLPACSSQPPAPRRGRGDVSGLHVVGSRIVTRSGSPIRLRGFNVAGAEYSCVEGTGTFDTPDGAPPSADMVRGMAAWTGANAVRVPLNERCWLGGPGVSAEHSGQAYRDDVRAFVARLGDAGLVAILDLHRSAPGTATPGDQEPMPDRDHSPAFWRSVATTFAGDSSVVFDLFNEPFPFHETDSDRAWSCWRDGGCTLSSTNSGDPYVAAGMQELIDAIRSTGSRHIVFAGGVHWSEVLSRWPQYRPDDPAGQLGAAFHGYSFNEQCASTSCYDEQLGPVAADVPLLASEVGPDLALSTDEIEDGAVDRSCPPQRIEGTDFSADLLDWLDRHEAGYTPWSWNPWGDCWSLVENWSGSPTPVWGAFVRDRLAAAD